MISILYQVSMFLDSKHLAITLHCLLQRVALISFRRAQESAEASRLLLDWLLNRLASNSIWKKRQGQTEPLIRILFINNTYHTAEKVNNLKFKPH